MKINYFRTAAKSYMIVSEVKGSFENYELQMVLQNAIKGLLPMQVIWEKEEPAYWYEVTGMQSFQKQPEFISLQGEQLEMLMHQICDLKRHLEAYFLEDLFIDYSPETIYFDRLAKRFRFCYIPGMQHGDGNNMETLMEYLLQHVDHSDEKTVQTMYELYEQTMQGGFSIEMCHQILHGTQWEVQSDHDHGKKNGHYEGDFHVQRYGGQASVSEVTGENPWMVETADRWDIPESDGAREHREVSKREKKRATWKERRSKQKERPGTSFSKRSKRKKDKLTKPQDKKEDIPKSFLELLEEADRDYIAERNDVWKQTVCFSDFYRNQVWEFHYTGEGMEEDFTVEHTPFLIGKDREAVDRVLVAETISRVHACIQEREGELYLEDYNSTNGTYVNGRIIPLNTEIKLEKGDHIIFATEEFTLRQTLKIRRA